MALLFIDSFDHYQNQEIFLKWTGGWAGAAAIDPGKGRCGTQALVVQSLGPTLRGMVFTGNTFICGYAFKQDSQWSLGGAPMLGIDALAGSHGQLSRNTDGSVSYQIGVIDSSGTSLSVESVPNVLHDDTWYYIEWKVVFSTTAGTCVVRVDGLEVINYSGPTVGFGAAGPVYAPYPLPPRQLRVQGQSNTKYWIDDLYVLDGTGPAPWNAFLGDCHVEYLRPRAAGASQDWTPVGTGTHWVAVDDNDTPDEDATYVESNTPGQIDTNKYQPTGLPTSPLFGAQLSLYARKSDIGPRVIAPVANGVVGAMVAPSFENYQYFCTPYPVNPADGNPWTPASINASEFGVKAL